MSVHQVAKNVLYLATRHTMQKSNVNVLVNAVNTPNKILIDADTARKFPNGAIKMCWQ